jgi:transcriptional regulator with XRE-family HTH domain
MCNALDRIHSTFTGFRRIVKEDFSKAMSFGSRLAEERKRLGLRQAEFADLVGTDVPKQSLYENDRRELRADYLARLAEADVDVVYVLTGQRSEGGRLAPELSEMVGLYLALPPGLRQALLDMMKAMAAMQGAPAGATLHGGRLAYRAEEPR